MMALLTPSDAIRDETLTGVTIITIVTPMAMMKTQVYLPKEDLEALHRVARKKGRPVAELIREAVRERWLKKTPEGPVAIWDGPFEGSSVDHDAAFDDAR